MTHPPINFKDLTIDPIRLPRARRGGLRRLESAAPPQHRSTTPNARGTMGTYDASRPAPTLVSAENVGEVPGEPGLINVRIVFQNADPAARLISAYFPPIEGHSAATQNIEGAALAAGEATVPIGGWVQTVMLRHMWGTLPGDGIDIVWGPWSAELPVTSSAATGGGAGGSQAKGKGPKHK